jgi:methanethiol S-methyltransferase
MISVILIFLVFALIHSITVTRKFKRACRALLGATFMQTYYRALYNAVSFITAGIAFLLIHRVPDQLLWTAPSWLSWIMHGIQIAAIAFASLAFEYLDVGEFMGIKQIWRYISRHEVAGNIEGQTQKNLVTNGVYGIVRHPLYFAGLVLFTFNPHITVNSLAVTILADAYFLFGMFIEERRFLMIFGDQYREYMKRVPRFIPGWRRRGSKKTEA